MMNKLSVNELEFIVSRILDNANEALSSKDDSDFVQGKKLAYYEMLDTIKNELEVREIDTKDFGLNITLENLL